MKFKSFKQLINFHFAFIVIIIFSITGIIEVYSQQLTTPVSIHFPILLKSLEYNRNLDTIATEKIKIGILYQGNYRSSINNKNQIIKYINDNKIINISKFSLEFVLIEFKDYSSLINTLRNENLYSVYITPLRATDVTTITQIFEQFRVLTVTGVTDYIHDDIAITVDIVGERPKIVINLDSIRKCGCDFKVSLLKLAKIVKSDE